MFGVALALSCDGLISVKDIIRKHLDMGEKCYFSTGYRFDGRKLAQSKKILLYSKMENVYYLGNIEKIEFFGLKEGIPKDSDVYSPKEYANIPQKAWFLISNLRKKDLDDLKEYTYKDIAVSELIKKSKRGTKFYFSD